jgi:plastocyanin
MRSSSIHHLAPLVVLGALASTLWPQTPRAYSYTLDPAPNPLGASIVKLARDGPLEAVDQFLPPGPGRDKEFHNHILYNFQAHKIYTQIVSDPSVPCSVMTYTSPAAPDAFDVMNASPDIADFLAQAKLLRNETVNGIPAKVMEMTADQMRITAWIADPGGFPVKEIITGQDGKTTTMLEMKQLRFAKPPASTFLPPSGCTAIQGEATATGVNAQFGSSESASKPATNVTAVTLQPVSDFTGPCPANIKLTGTITVDGPGKVFYQFGVGKMEPGDTVTFTAAGTKTVSHVVTFNKPDPGFGNQIGVGAILEATGEDASGNHDMFMKGSNNASFTITCTDAATASPQPPTVSNARVTAVDLQVTPAAYSGVCPVTVQLVGTLTADGPGSAYYQFQAAAVAANRSGNVDVSKAGTVTVSNQGVVRRTPQVQSVRFLAGMEPRGHQENARYKDVNLNIHCTNAP